MPKHAALLTLIAVFVLSAAASVRAQNADPIGVLKSDASLQDKGEACRVLARSGGPEAVPVLAAMLVDEKLSHMARGALEPMPCAEAGDALRGALGKTSGRLKIGVISSLAVRRDEKVIPEIVKLLSDADAGVAQAAADFLGTLATPATTKALEDAMGQANVSPGNLEMLCDGLFASAEKLAKEGQRDQAVALYDRVLEVANASKPIRAGALRGAILCRGTEQGLPPLLDALRGDDGNLFAAALRVARELDGGETLSAGLAGLLPAMPAERKVRLIQVLGERGGAAAGPAVLAEAKEGPTEIRVAAIRALVRMKYSPALAMIEELVRSGDKEVAAAARDALSYFPGNDREAMIAAMLADKDAGNRQIAIELIGAGGVNEPLPFLLKSAETDKDEGVRVAALKASGNCAGLEEIPALLGLLTGARSQAETQAAEGALASVCERQKRMPGNIVILKATYGDLPNGPSADVTEKVKSIAGAGPASVDVSNANFGDPAPGIPKKLCVEYTANGAAFSKTAAEGASLKLTTAIAPAALVEAFCSAQEKARGDARLALLRLLGSTASPKALEVVRKVAAAENGAVKETAQRTLCDWPAPDALPTLMELVKTSGDDMLKVLALRGAVRLLDQSDVAPDELLANYAELMEHAGTADEKKTVLAGLSRARDAAALELIFSQFADVSVKAEAIQAAVAMARRLGKSAVEDASIFNGKDLTGWQSSANYWRVEDGAIIGQSAQEIPKNTFLWSGAQVDDFYLSVDVQLEPNTANAGIQFRSKKVDEYGQALGYQADVGVNVWGRLYHEHGRGKLDWTDRAESAVLPGQWNHYEILAVGPAIWTAINGKLGTAFLDTEKEWDRSGLIAVQLHAGPPQTVRYRIGKLIRNPKVELAGLTTEQLINELKPLAK